MGSLAFARSPMANIYRHYCGLVTAFAVELPQASPA